MARLVFAVHGLRSGLNNTAALARQLVDRGHDVTFVSFRDVGSAVEHIGAKFILLADGPNAVAELRNLRAERGDLRSVRRARHLRAKVLELDESVRVLSELSPDLVVVDMEMHGLVLAARHLRLPTLLTLSWHDPMRSWKRPPMHRDIVARGRRDIPRTGLAWIDLIARRRLRQALGPLVRSAALARVLPQHVNTSDLNSVRTMARNLGVDLSAISSRHEWVHPHTYTHAPVISFTAKELEFDQSSPAGVIHIGPCIDQSRYQRSLTAETRRELSAFLLRFGQPGSRLAYCSMGSLQAANQSYYQMVADAFRSKPEWGLILGLGSQGAGLHLDVEADRVLVLDDAPQTEILRQVDVAVHTGGASTFYECLRFGVPSIIMHTGKTDMAGIAARTTHFHLGVVRDRETVTADRLADDAAELASGSTAGPINRLSRVILDYEARAEGVRVIEGLLNNAKPSPT